MQKDSVQHTKEHILEVARKEFFNKGYGAASINTVVEAADVTKPTIYYHFKNKEGLFKALLEESFDRCFENRRQAVDANLPVAEQITQVVAADFEFCLRQPELVRFILAQTFNLPGESDHDLTDIHYRDYEFFRELLARGLERGELKCPDIASAALALQGIIDINIVSFLKMNHEPDFLSAQRAAEITQMFLYGINQNQK